MIFTNKNLKYNYKNASVELKLSKSIWALLANLVILFTAGNAIT